MYNMDARLPAHQAARLVGVSRQLINYWRAKGKLKPVDRQGRASLYRLADVMAVESAMRNSPQSRRCA
jgi:DNA-binding transcriptional MerR regulator